MTQILLNFIFAYAIALGIFIYITLQKTNQTPKLGKKFDIDMETVTLSGITCGFIVGIVLIVLLTHKEIIHFEVLDDDYRTLLSTVATIIGTILTVSFSILILGIQHALSNYAPSLLRYFVIEKTTITSFIMLSFSTIICLFGLMLPWRSTMVGLAYFFLTYSFVILAYYFYIRSKTSTSISIFEQLRKDARRYIEKKIEKKLKAQVIQASKNPFFANPTLNLNTELQSTMAQLITGTVFHTTGILKPIQDYIDEIVGLIHRNLQSNDYESVKHGLKTISRIVQYYIKNRRHSPDDKLIESLYEQIKSITIIAIEKKNPYVLKSIVETYEEIGILTTSIPLLHTGINYQFTTGAIYYLNELFYIVGRFGDINLQVIRAMRKIAVSSIRKGGDDVLTLDYYSKMVNNLEEEKFFLLYRDIIGATSEIINSSIDMFQTEANLKMKIDYLIAINTMTIRRLNDFDANAALLPLIEDFPGFPNNVHVMISKLLNLKTKANDDLFIRSIERHSFDALPHFIGCLLNVISIAVKKKYYFVIRTSLRTLYFITLTLLGERFVLQLNFNSQIQRLIESISNFFLGLYTKDEDLDDSIFYEILDVLTSISIQCVYSDKLELANNVVDKLLELSLNVAKFDKYGFHTVRIANKIMIIGVLSIEKNLELVTKNVLKSLESYDSKIRVIVEEFHQRDSTDEFRKEVNRIDEIFDSRLSPIALLKGKISNDTWDKSKILNPK